MMLCRLTHEMATLLKSNLPYFHPEKRPFEKLDAGIKLRIVFLHIKRLKTEVKNFVSYIYTLKEVLALSILILPPHLNKGIMVSLFAQVWVIRLVLEKITTIAV